MAIQNAVFVQNLNTTFDIGVAEPNKISIKIDGTLVKNLDGSLGINGASLTVVSADAGNIIVAGTDGKAYLDQAALQAVETVWSGTEPDSFLTITPGGINGHNVTYGFDWTNTAFIEAVQDAVGQAILSGAGITYDDVANAISTTIGNIAFGDGLALTGSILSVLPDPASPSTVTVGPAGVNVIPGISTDTGNMAVLGTDNKVLVDTASIIALATVDVCDAFGVHMFNAYP